MKNNAVTLIELPVVSRSAALTTGKGFTLIELLVVITIIVVLLALLTPALDKAIYQAELAICAAHQRGFASAATTYAVGNKRLYPAHRPPAAGDHETPELRRTNNYQTANNAQGQLGYGDMRELIRDYLGLDMFNDPLAGGLDFDPGQTGDENLETVWANFNIFSGWGYLGVNGNSESVMARIGQRFSWTDGDVKYRFSVLASDLDRTNYNSGSAGHPDDAGAWAFELMQDEPNPWDPASLHRVTYSWYYGNQRRGLIDTNHALADNSVARLTDVPMRADDDDRIVDAPHWADAYEWPGRTVHLMRE